MIKTRVFMFLLTTGLASSALAQAPATAPATKPAPPVITAPAKPAEAAKPAAPQAALIDINSASKEELMALKGIGEVRATDIIKKRPYKGKDDLVQKNIIPQGVYDDIKDKIIAKQK